VLAAAFDAYQPETFDDPRNRTVRHGDSFHDDANNDDRSKVDSWLSGLFACPIVSHGVA